MLRNFSATYFDSGELIVTVTRDLFVAQKILWKSLDAFIEDCNWRE